MLNEYEVPEKKRERIGAARLRVAHWAILDGHSQPVPAASNGRKVKLRLEPWESYPRLESLYLSDTLDPDVEIPIYVDVSGLTRSQPRPSWPNEKAAGWSSSARISRDSTSRGPGAVEVLVAVGDVDAAVARRAQRREARPLGEERQLGARTREVEAAGQHQDRVGIGGREILERDAGRVRAGAAEHAAAAGQRDELRHPVAGHHQRVEPLDAGEARPLAEAAGALAEGADALREAGEQLAPARRDARRLGDRADRAPYLAERGLAPPRACAARRPATRRAPPRRPCCSPRRPRSGPGSGSGPAAARGAAPGRRGRPRARRAPAHPRARRSRRWFPPRRASARCRQAAPRRRAGSRTRGSGRRGALASRGRRRSR